MNSNNKDKVKNFFRKEGFYFVLFICLCVIATFAVFTMNRNSTASNKKSSDEFSLNVEEKLNDQSQGVMNNEKIQNAERVENDTNENINEVAELNEDDSEVANATEENGEELASSEEDVAVMSGNDSAIVFSLPLEGTVTRCFGDMIEVKNTDEEQIIMTRKGVDLQAPVGTTVKCVADGQVEEVASSSEDGNYVVVSHANGLKTKYANLDPEINVSVGDILSEGQEIGVVGDSSLVFTSDICGDVLNLQVIDANGVSIDPASYFNF